MFFLICVVAFQLATRVYRAEAAVHNVAQAFEDAYITTTLQIDAPTGYISVSYPSGVSVELGKEVTPTQVKDQPTVSYEADPDAYYTLIFSDPDNYKDPQPIDREYQHWLVGNIRGSNVAEGEVLSQYIGPGPPEGSGLHRYTFTLFRQPNKLSFDERRLDNKSLDGRAGFSTKKFVEKYYLGAPVAGNFFRAQYDDYVPELYKSLGVQI